MQVFAFKGKASASSMAAPKPNCFSRKKIVSPQLRRIMKLTGIILLAACLQVSAKGITQTVSLSAKDAPFIEVIKSIERQTHYAFFYKVDWLAEAKKVTIKAVNMPLKEALDICFKNQPFSYIISGRNITIKPKDNFTSIEEKLPPIDVKGRVVDANGQPVVGATVSVKGGSKTTLTDSDGSFILPGVEGNAVIVISHVQYEMQSLTINGRSIVNATLQIKINSLDEMQVIAYGTTTKRFQTGNVSIVKSDDIQKQPINNPLLALEGRVPGLFITQATGLPGSGVQVAIQGKNSFNNNGNDPFYVIDGVPYTSQLLPNYGNVLGASTGGIYGNPLSFLNPADIESISVLKDADATAIYGSRGANGVILITTKKGKAGQTKVDINMQTGWGKVTRKLDVLNTQQYLEMRREAKRNNNLFISSTDYDINGLWDTTRYTDWQKELIGNTARYTDVNATVSGGNANTQVIAGVGYHRETTVFPGDLSDQKGSLHFSMNNVSTNQKFRMQLTGNYLEDNNRITSRDLTQSAITLAPNAPKIYNEDGSLNWMPDPTGISSWDNPLAYIYNKYKNKSKNLVGNAVISYQIIPALEIKSSFGYTNLQSNEILTNPLLSVRPEDRLTTYRGASYSYNNISSWIIEPQISYKRKFGNSRLEALLGTTIQKNTSNGLRVAGYGYNSDIVLEDIKSAPNIVIDGNTVNSVYKYNALFSRISYNLLDKYLLNLTARRDGSSRFGPGNQFHNFGAVGVGWVFSKEAFIQEHLPFISFGKLKGSYGTTGNDQIGDYKFMTLYTPPSTNVGAPYQGVNGLQPNGLTNIFLQWEETTKLQMGLDLSLFKEKIIIAATYFRNRSGNQLLSYLLPIQTGFGSISKNLPAIVQNSGWEFSINASNIKTRNFSWSTDFNLTVPKNQLLEFPNIAASGYGNSYIVGEPITLIKVYRFAGVNPSNGVYQFLNYNGNLTSSPSSSTDKTVLINTSPTFYGGFHNSFTYKNFELDFLFQFIKRKGPNYLLGDPNGALTNFNQPVSVLDRWQKPGDITLIQRYYSNGSLFSQASNAGRNSDAAYMDASFARLKNFSLSYKIPSSWYGKVKLQNARLYVQGQNLLTITNYSGLDPETLSSAALPPLKVVTVGMQLVL